jgi:glutamate synthase (NADPH/NADH) small chain
MGKITGFLEYARLSEANLPVAERLTNYNEFVQHLSDDEAKIQGARCMDCGIPFCMSGCPINNIIPDWNDLVFKNSRTGGRQSTSCIPPTTSRSSPAASVRRRVKPPAR